MRRRISVLAAVATIGLVVFPTPERSNADVVGFVQSKALNSNEENDRYAREMLGLAYEPAEELTTDIGGIPLSPEELSLYQSYDRVIHDQIPLVDKTLKSIDDVVTWSLDRSLANPGVSLFVDAKSTRAQEIEKRIASSLPAEWSVKSKPSPITKEDRNVIWWSLVNELNKNKGLNGLVNPNYPTGSLAKTLSSSGIRVTDAFLYGNDYRVALAVAPGDSEKTRQTLQGLRTSTGRLLTEAIRVDERAPSTPLTGRLEYEPATYRGGKRLDPVGCSTGPAVRNVNDGTDYGVTAGHCFTPTKGWQVYPYSTVTSGGASLTALRACYLCTWGVDAAILLPTIGVVPTGWFVHQAPGDWAPPGFQAQGPAYLDLTLNSQDLYNGLQLVCVEGASPSKYYSPVYGLDARSTCGISQGWNSEGLYDVIMYPGSDTCGGDSGGLVRHPTGSGGSYGAGIISSHSANADGSNDIGSGCVRSYHLNWTFMQVSQWWPIHEWWRGPNPNGPNVWLKTW